MDFNPESTSRVVVNGIIYQLWDLYTLFLYARQVLSFRKIYTKDNNNKIYARIMSILQRILILTLFYEILWVYRVIAGTISKRTHIVIVFSQLASVIISYSMMLMMKFINKMLIKL
eukprot:109283_1